MKAVVAAFNQEKALVGAFSVITNLRMELFQALVYRDCIVEMNCCCLNNWDRNGHVFITSFRHLAKQNIMQIICLLKQQNIWIEYSFSCELISKFWNLTKYSVCLVTMCIEILPLYEYLIAPDNADGTLHFIINTQTCNQFMSSDFPKNYTNLPCQTLSNLMEFYRNCKLTWIKRMALCSLDRADI